MEKDRKILVSSITGGAVIVIIIIVAVTFPGFHNNNNTQGNSHFNRANFNSRTVSAQNNSLYVSGLGDYTIKEQNKSHMLSEYFEFTHPGIGLTGLTNDIAAYLNLSGTHIVYENLTFPDYTITIVTFLSNESVTQGISLNNTGPSLQKFSFSYNLYTSIVGNITLLTYPNNGGQEQNITIVPHTYGYTESYSFYNGGLNGIEYPYYNNTTVSWSELSGLYTDGTLTFNQVGTEMALNFGQVSLPPGDYLDLGNISILD